jgi:hypothetical protein
MKTELEKGENRLVDPVIVELHAVLLELEVNVATSSGRSGPALDSNQLCSTGRTALDGHCGLAAAEVASDQRDKLRIRLALHRRRLQLSEPGTIFGRREQADASAWPDRHLDDRCLPVLGLSAQTRLQGVRNSCHVSKRERVATRSQVAP